MSYFGSVIGRRGLGLVALAALALAGCARQQGHQQAAHPAPGPAPRAAYCEPRPAPDCEFRETSLKTVDATEFSRLKLAYESRCLRQAEKIERERMRQLHTSGACDRRPAPSLAASR